MKFSGLLLALSLAAVTLPAATINFAGGHSLGSSHTYGLVTATGYISNGTTTTLYGKGTPGGTGSEDGLGLQRDPSGDDEIFAGNDFVQLDIAALSGPIKIALSSTAGDTWAIFGSNSAGILGSVKLASGGSDDDAFVNVLNAASYQYLDVTAQTNNVLLQQLSYSSAAPEPGMLGLVGGGLLSAAALIRRRRKDSLTQ
jgi:hypothetical protein